MYIVGLIISFITGGTVGVIVMCLMFAASQSDDQLIGESQYKETK